MIYILGKSYLYGEEKLTNAIVMISTKIEKLLEYAYNEMPVNRLNDYEISIYEDGGFMNDCICLTNDAYEHLIKYPSSLFLKEEHKEEFETVCDHLRNWCDAIREKKRKIKEEQDQREAARKEKEERLLYEKLKKKYGDA